MTVKASAYTEARGKAKYIREFLATTLMFAAVRLLASVGTMMNGQCASLNKCLGAASVCAIVRSLVGVYSKVTLEVGLAIEALMTHS